MHEPIIEQARKFLSWLDATQVPATAGAVLPRTDLHRFRELANGVWQAWFVATVEAGHRLPDDTEAAFRAFEDAVFPEDWNGRVLLVQQVRQQQTKFPSFPVHDPHELAYDPSRLAAVRKALERIAGPPAAKSPAPPTANSNRTPDTKPDTQKISCPKSPRLLALIKKLQRDVVPGVRLIDVARDFVDGDDKKAESLLRQANRYKHLWKTGHTGR